MKRTKGKRTMERLSIGDDDDDEVAARWLSTLEETKRMAARHAADVAAAAAAAAQRGDDAWVDVAGGGSDYDAPMGKRSSSSTPSSTSISAASSKTSTSTRIGVPRDSGDAWRQEEWHIAFVVLVREGITRRPSRTQSLEQPGREGEALTFFSLSLFKKKIEKFFEAPAAALRSGGDHSDDLLFFVLSEKEAASRSCAAAASAAEARRAASASAAPPGSTRAAAAVARRFVGGGGRVGGGGGAGSGAAGGITNDIGDCGVLLVRRRTGGRRPPAGFGLGEGRAAAVDWRATVVLNLALQSSYALAVVACRKGALRDSSSSVPRAIAAASSSAAVAAAAAAAASAAARNEAGGPPRAAAAAACSETSASGPLPPLALPLGGHGVRHDVFASPMRLAFEEIGGATDGSSPEPSYPEICFSVDGASSSSGLASSSSSSPAPLSALSSELELASPGDVFAVFLVATGGPALATGPATAATEEGGGGKEEDGGGGKEEEDESKKKTKTKKEPFVEIFSGFVSYEQLVDALPCAKIAASSSSYREYGGGGGDARREHVRMRGPGGKGVADVAVGVLFRKDATPSSAAVSPAHPSFSSSSSGRDLVARTVAERDGFGGSAAPDAAAATPSSSSALAATARALLRAAAAAVAPPRPPPPTGAPVFGCSLFCLSLPVETLAGRLLGLPDSSSSSQ